MRAERRQERKARILKAAETLFAEYGYRRTSLDDIAKKAGMSKANLYHYVKSKEALFEELVRNFFDAYVQKLEEALGNTQDPRTKLVRYADVLMNHHREGWQRSKRHMDQIEEEFPVIFRVIRQFRDVELRLIRSILREGVEQGLFKLDNIELGASLLHSAFKGMITEVCENHEDIDHDMVVSSFLNTILNGLLATSESTQTEVH